MSEKSNENEKNNIIVNKNEEFLNIIGKYNQNNDIDNKNNLFNEQDKEKDEINFDSIDFNMNPFNNENQTEQENSQNIKYNNDTQIGQKYKSTNYLTKKDIDEKDLNTKNLKSNNDNDISTINVNNNIRNIQSPKTLINPIYTYYNDNTSVNNNNNQYIMPKTYNNFGSKSMISNPLISNPINNINYNSNHLIQNLNNQINYSNNNNNSFYYNITNINQINYINNNFNFSPLYRKQNWICSHCTSFNSEGKNYLFNYDFLLI